MYLKTLEKHECTACTACVIACPKQCIKMTTDEEGFLYPFIEQDCCIHCGLCEKICPHNKSFVYNNENIATYAGYIKDIDERRQSSSGGIFFSVASWIIKNGGIVYGATIDDKFQVFHIGIDNLKDLDKLRGSKYVQSNLGSIFKDVKHQLNLNRWVYFVGTGCQVAGLKSYLKKDFPTLLTTDLVCHGVPSQKLFDEHIYYLNHKYNGHVKKYSFRDNANWGGCEIFDIEKNGKIQTIKNRTYFKSPYLNAFMLNYVLRYSCYKCEYARRSRIGDLTLADYWGIENIVPQIDKKHGVSMLMVNSSKGEFIRNQIGKECILWETSIEDAEKYNQNLTHTTEMVSIRSSIFNSLQSKGYEYVAKTTFRSNKYYKTIIMQFLLSNNHIKKIIVSIRNYIEKL